MKALIFAAGLGTRLRPLTNNRPKALVEVGGVAMLERVANRLVASGVKRIVVNAHHFADKIVEFVERKDGFGVETIVSVESELLLDTGGGLLATRRWLDGDEPILVHNADILADFSIDAMLDAHQSCERMSTLLVKERKTSRYLLIDEDMRMCGWTNEKTGQILPLGLNASDMARMAFGGVHIISPCIFDHLERYAKSLPADTPVDSFGRKAFPIMPFYISQCPSGEIYGYVPSEEYCWHDIGKLESLREAERSVAGA